MRRLLLTTVVALLVGAGTVAGCSRSPSAGGPSAAPSSTGPSSAAAPASTSTFERACTPDVLLPLLKSRFDDPAANLVIERVDIQRCRGGYAHVFAVPGAIPGSDEQYESEQLFLRYDNGQWQSVAEGTGLACEDPDNPPELLTACRALGYLS